MHKLLLAAAVAAIALVGLSACDQAEQPAAAPEAPAATPETPAEGEQPSE
jgi:hypothetical protein